MLFGSWNNLSPQKIMRRKNVWVEIYLACCGRFQELFNWSKWNKTKPDHFTLLDISHQLSWQQASRSVKKRIVQLTLFNNLKAHSLKMGTSNVTSQAMPGDNGPVSHSIFMLSLGFLWVSWATFCFTQWANGSIPMNLLVARQACLHGRWLLLAEVPLPWRTPFVD